MTLLPKDPLALFSLFQKQMEELSSFLTEIDGGRRGLRIQTPHLDVYETADQIVVEVELPGVERESIQLRLFRNILVVEGVKRKEQHPAGITFHCLERRFGRFIRVLEVPAAADLEQVRASVQKGMLVISFARQACRQGVCKMIPVE